jgi:hypothetical protein
MVGFDVASQSYVLKLQLASLLQTITVTCIMRDAVLEA